MLRIIKDMNSRRISRNGRSKFNNTKNNDYLQPEMMWIIQSVLLNKIYWQWDRGMSKFQQIIGFSSEHFLKLSFVALCTPIFLNTINFRVTSLQIYKYCEISINKHVARNLLLLLHALVKILIIDFELLSELKTFS